MVEQRAVWDDSIKEKNYLAEDFCYNARLRPG